MRISTSQIYNAGALGIQRNQQGLYSLQNQLSTGRRVLTPEDDPVAAAQALIVTQSKDMVSQQTENQGYARSQLGLVEGNLASLTDMLLAVHEKAYQSTNSGYSDTERGFIAKELQSWLDEMIAMANTDDGTGQYLFSGYQGATKPFAINGSGNVQYFGDDGARLLQVAASRQMPANVSGAELFMNIRSGNGVFETSVGGNGGSINQGTAVIDAGSVSNPALWRQAVDAYPSPGGAAPFASTAFRIEFSVVGATTTYTLYDANELPSPTTPLSSGAFVPGQAIELQDGGGSFGARVVVSGQPANGDTFVVQPSTDQSIFQTMQNVIDALNTPVNAAFTNTELQNVIRGELSNLDRAVENLGKVRADVGSRLKELDFLKERAADLDLQYATTLADLQDLDYVDAISRFTQQQMQLEAAQKSFAQVSGLSLFSIL